MYKLPTGLLLAAAFFTVLMPVGSAETTPPPVKFGMDSAGIAAEKAAGVAPDYGTFWIGPWTLTSGWGGPDNELATMKAAGVTPAVHFYYWGDDISPSCVENGCWSSLHNAQKDRAHWNTLATQMTDHLNSKMGGAPVVVFLESEFNKGGISTYEPYDGYLAAMANKINAAYPAAIVVLGYGNWDSGNWGTFDRAAAASEMVGLQGMRGSTKDSLTHYKDLDESTLTGVQKLQGLFHKPIMLTDIALSSYPDSTYTQVQADELQALFATMPSLKAAGVTAMIYRSWKDSPNMDLANYYGEAERHWGLAKSDGTQKTAAQVWIKNVKAERAGTTTTTSTTTTTTSTTTQTAKVTPSGNAWWVQAAITSSKTVTKVEAKVGSGAFVALDKQSYGWTKSLSVPSGTSIQFRVTASDGTTATTAAQSWIVDMSAKTATYTSGTTSSTTTTAATTTSTFMASFVPKSQSNNWWIETSASGNQAIVKVEAKVNAGSYVTLDKTSYGTWAKSVNAPDGAKVTFRATSSTGATATSAAFTWG